LAGTVSVATPDALSVTVPSCVVPSTKVTGPAGIGPPALTVAVKNPDGSTTDWVMTTGSATSLAQRGIGKTGPNALKAGETITVKFLPAKNGSPLGFLKTVITADGRVIQMSAGNAND